MGVAIRQHDYKMHVALKNHLPKVQDRVGQRALSRDVEPLGVRADAGAHVTGVDKPGLVLFIRIHQANSIIVVRENIFESGPGLIFGQNRGVEQTIGHFLLRNSFEFPQNFALFQFGRQIRAQLLLGPLGRRRKRRGHHRLRQQIGSRSGQSVQRGQHHGPESGSALLGDSLSGGFAQRTGPDAQIEAVRGFFAL